ncbi:uncharacterized protein LOC115875324 [Sitophilus oryzae]|uniref:Uncharacterized protein LOC115875324 n=1 Tax=Sitophilus oryzae TaxID=7048 RepID=A0A6J2X6U0_SITOR|nr:uncharacterized protein LOC115875324 [Sitophilus oryzae]
MSSATFEANPNSENEPWIEKPAFEGLKFRIWHIMFFCVCAFGVLVVLICCCVRIRIPRTKQEIEADYKRKKITTKFRKRLKFISNQEMEAINLQKALEIIIEADYKPEDDADVFVNPNATENQHLVPSSTTNFGDKVSKVISMGRILKSQNIKY